MNELKHTDKPWGYEELLSHNDRYIMKRLFMKKDHCCSLQYHNQKHETIYVLFGTLQILEGDDMEHLELKEYKAGDICIIPPKRIHRMIGWTDVFYLEASTPELDDVVRLHDNYGRK